VGVRRWREPGVQAGRQAVSGNRKESEAVVNGMAKVGSTVVVPGQYSMVG